MSACTTHLHTHEWTQTSLHTGWSWFAQCNGNYWTARPRLDGFSDIVSLVYNVVRLVFHFFLSPSIFCLTMKTRNSPIISEHFPFLSLHLCVTFSDSSSRPLQSIEATPPGIRATPSFFFICAVCILCHHASLTDLQQVRISQQVVVKRNILTSLYYIT